MQTDLPQLKKYTLLQHLASGGMGAVYLAQREGSAQVCVVKTILTDHLANETVRRRFVREAWITSALQHPRICKVLDAGMDEDLLYIAMEFIPGCDLERLMFHMLGKEATDEAGNTRRGFLVPPGLALTVAQDLLDALHQVHELRDSEGRHYKLVHRDLSPRNVMVTFDGEGRLIDFGVVRSKLGDWRTATGMLMGTVRYISPEQAVAAPTDQRSDVYAFATMLWELLSGQHFILEGPQFDMLERVMNKPAIPLMDVNPALPAALTPVLLRAMAKDADDRYPSAEAFRLALREAAPDLSDTPRERIVAFLQQELPEQRAWAERIRAIGQTMASETVADEPAPELTRAAVPDLAAGDVPSMPPTRVGRPASLSATEAPTPAPPTDVPSPAAATPPPGARPVTVGERRVYVAIIAGLVAVALVLFVMLLSSGGPATTAAVEPAPSPAPAPAEAAPGVAARAAEPSPAEAPPPLRRSPARRAPPTEETRPARAEPPEPPARAAPDAAALLRRARARALAREGDAALKAARAALPGLANAADVQSCLRRADDLGSSILPCLELARVREASP